MGVWEKRLTVLLERNKELLFYCSVSSEGIRAVFQSFQLKRPLVKMATGQTMA